MSDGRRDPQNAYLTSAFQKQSVDSTVAQMLGISTPDYQFRSEQRLAAAPPTIFCVACGKQITSNYIEKGGRPYCGDACAGPSSAATAKATFVTPSAESQQVRKAQEKEIYQNIQAGKSKCGGCGNVISDLSAVEYKGVMFHEYCFACSKCGQQIGSVVGFASTPSGPVCNRYFLPFVLRSSSSSSSSFFFFLLHYQDLLVINDSKPVNGGNNNNNNNNNVKQMTTQPLLH